MNRRQFLQASAATVALASCAPVASVVAPVEAPAALTLAEATGWTWGYSIDGEVWWFAGSREEAIEEAADALGEGGKVEVGLCRNVALWFDLHSDAVDWFVSEDWSDSLAEHCRWRFAHSNEEADFEGELTDAIEGADTNALEAPLRKALANALLRAGRPDLAYLVEARSEAEEWRVSVNRDLELVLHADAVFRAEIEAAMRSWAGACGIDKATRCIDLMDTEEVPVPARAG